MNHQSNLRVEKVKLPKEIATYIEDLLIRGNAEMLIYGVLGNANSPKYVAVRKHFDKDFDSLLQALVNGYEVEETPEDKVRQYFKYLAVKDKTEYHCEQDYNKNYWRAEEVQNAIKDTLDILNIKIEGVNA